MIRFVLRLFSLFYLAARFRLDHYLKLLEASAPQAQKPMLSRMALLIRLHPASWFAKPRPNNLKQALEHMGVLFLKGGQLLSTRHDLLPPLITSELKLLQDKIKPIDVAVIQDQIESALGQPTDQLFERFDTTPLAAASIAQVHTASFADGKEVVVKVLRPDVAAQIEADFKLLHWLSHKLESRYAAAKAQSLAQVVQDYHVVMRLETDLAHEAQNQTRMRNNFLGSADMYLPEVYAAASNVIVMERIQGVPVSDKHTLEALGVDLEALANKGLRVFFTQLLRDNFFHADMHPGNVYVETLNPENPRFIGLDCAIVGTLTDSDRLLVARILLSVMNADFGRLTELMQSSGWVAQHAGAANLTRDLERVIGPMVSKPIDQIDFAGVLTQVLDVARTYQIKIPPSFMLLIKTLVHVEGMGRELYPKLDIWTQAKPLISSWINSTLSPSASFNKLKQAAPEFMVSATELPSLIQMALNNVRRQSHWHAEQLAQQHEHQLKLEKLHKSSVRLFSAAALLGVVALSVPSVSMPALAALSLLLLFKAVF